MTAVRARCSFSNNGESSATQSGPVLTNTTELATLVYSSDDIQVAKCAARKMPEKTQSRISVRVKRFISSRCLMSAIGARIRVAKVSLNAAMTREGAPSLCAKRIKMLAVETASMAIKIAKGSITRDWNRSSVSSIDLYDICIKIVEILASIDCNKVKLNYTFKDCYFIK